MSVIATRSLSDGSRASAWPLSRDVSNAFGASMLDGGTVPFENLLRPKSSIHVLHAAISQSGFSEFDPEEEGDFTPDPDKRYRVKTYTGTITNSAGRNSIPPPDPLPPDYEPQYEFLARDTTDNRVMTYELDYSSTDTEEDPDGWTMTEEGERTTGEVYVYSTGAIDEGPEPNPAEGGVTSPTESLEVGTISGEITCTLTEQVTIDYLTDYCEEKLGDLKSRADDVPEEVPPPEEGEEPPPPGPAPVNIESEIDSFQTDALSVKLASVRMVWEGSGMFAPLAGSLTYFTSGMQPNINLTTGSWQVEVSNEVSASEKYYDGMGMFGESSWWSSEFSDFGDYVAGPLVTPNDGLYPGSGIETGPAFKKARLRWFSVDGKKRRIQVLHSPQFIGSPESGSYRYKSAMLETSPLNGFAQATAWLDVEVVAVMDIYRIEESVRINDDGSEIVEFGDEGQEFNQSFWQLAIISQQREGNRWGFKGFSSYILDGEEGAEIPDIRYAKVTISSTSLIYSARDPDPVPDGVGKTATGSMSGEYTLTKPSQWALGSLNAERRFSKTSAGFSSPFKMTWTSAGYSGEKELKVIDDNSDIPSINFGPFSGSGDELEIDENRYRVSVDELAEGSRPVRDYRIRWDRNIKSPKPVPDTTTITFSLPAPATGTRRQVSDWQDLPVPGPGVAMWTESFKDELSCFVGS